MAAKSPLFLSRSLARETWRVRKQNHVETGTLEQLLQAGADPHAVVDANPSIMEALCDKNSNFSASVRGKILKLFVEYGANPMVHAKQTGAMVHYSPSVGRQLFGALREREEKGAACRDPHGNNLLHHLVANTQEWDNTSYLVMELRSSQLGSGDAQLHEAWVKQTNHQGQTAVHALLAAAAGIPISDRNTKGWNILWVLSRLGADLQQRDHQGVSGVDAILDHLEQWPSTQQWDLGIPGPLVEQIEGWRAERLRQQMERDTGPAPGLQRGRRL